jgi:glycosyltransferase involved in cell wall biosynthesis
MNKASYPPRLAIFFHDFGVGGAERVMLQLARGFIDLGYPVDLVIGRAEGPLISEVHPRARIIDLEAGNPLTMFVKLIQYLRTERPNALLSPFEVTSVIAIIAKRISRVSTRVIIRISVHISKNKRTKWKKILEKLVLSNVYPLADGIVTVSRGAAQDLSIYTGISPARIRVINNPVISDELLQAAQQPVNHPFFNADHVPVILGVGRLTEQKDFPTLIRAFDILRKKTPARLIILGDGEEKLVLEKLIRSSGLQDMVDLFGFELNPFAFMKKASVFVLSSKWEGLPGVLIQALACDCPVVSTDCLSGPSEILQDGQYGYLVPVEDAEAIASAIESVLGGDVRHPPKSWLEQYHIDSVIPQYKDLLGI